MKRGGFVLAIVGLVALTAITWTVQTAGRERSYRTLLDRGDAALREGDTFGAIEAFSGAVALRPTSMVAHLRRGESYRLRGELSAAARDFRTAAALDPRAPRPLDLLSDVYYERGRYDRSIDTLERRVRLDDRAPRPHYKLARSQYRAGRLTQALQSLANAIRLDGRMPDAYFLLGLCLRDQGQPSEALDAFERAVTLAPGLIPAREELASLYEQLGRYANQLEQLQVLAALDSAHIQRQVAVGTAHARAGHPEAAVVTLTNALERSPGEPIVYQELGRVWLDVASTRDDPTALRKAIEAFDHLGAGPTASSDALTLYGQALTLNGELDAAARVLEQATRRYPIDLDAFPALADVAERQYRHDVARAALIDYETLLGDTVATDGAAARAARIGMLSLRLNDAGTARRWLMRALEAEPEHDGWIQALAEAYAQTGDLTAAQNTLDRALERAPDNPDLVAARRQIIRAMAARPSPSSDQAAAPHLGRQR
jgi:tetratricopeptide (TPR) repeat protein